MRLSDCTHPRRCRHCRGTICGPDGKLTLPNLYSVSGIETHAQGLSFLSAGSKTVSRANNSLNHSCPDRRGPEGRLQELRDALWDIGRAGKYVNCSIAELRPGVNGKMRGGYHGKVRNPDRREAVHALLDYLGTDHPYSLVRCFLQCVRIIENAAAAAIHVSNQLSCGSTFTMWHE